MSRQWDTLQRWVVDASIVVKWFVPEPFSQQADAVLQDYATLMAPDIIWAELGNALWKKWRKSLITEDKAREILAEFDGLGVRLYPGQSLYSTAWAIATDTGRTFYDSLYLALAVSSGAFLVTADLRFYSAIKSTSWAHHCIWIEDVS